jgi:hypothetical protein
VRTLTRAMPLISFMGDVLSEMLALRLNRSGRGALEDKSGPLGNSYASSQPVRSSRSNAISI